MANIESKRARLFENQRIFLRFLIENAILLVVYVFSARVGLLFALAHGSVSLVWPPSGIALAALVVWGPRMLPGLVIGAFTVNLAVGDPWPFAIITALGNPAEAIAGALLLTRVLHFRYAMDRRRDILALPFVAAPLSAAIAATIGATGLQCVGSIAASAYGQTWFHWWLGDAIGMIVVAPVVFAFKEYGWPRRLVFLRALEGSALTSVSILGAVLLFGSTFSEWPVLAILIIPVLLVIAFRFSFREVVIANMLVAAGAVIGAERSYGVANPEIFSRELLTLATLLVVMSLTVQLLSILLQERKRIEEALRSERQQLLDIIEFLPDATFVIDRDKRVIAWNQACEILTGVKKESLLGKGDYAYATPFSGTRQPILIDLLDHPDAEIESHYKYVRRTGGTLFAESFNPNLRDRQGPIYGVRRACCLIGMGNDAGPLKSFGT